METLGGEAGCSVWECPWLPGCIITHTGGTQGKEDCCPEALSVTLMAQDAAVGLSHTHTQLLLAALLGSPALPPPSFTHARMCTHART